MSQVTLAPNSVLLTTGINATKGRRIYDDEQPLKDCVYCDVAEDGSVTMDKGEFYKMLVRKYGRCIGRVYVDRDGSAMPIGWAFVKRAEYTDCHETYLQETWVSFAAVTPKSYSALRVD